MTSSVLSSSVSSLAQRNLEAIRDVIGSPALNSATADTLEQLAPDDVNKPRLIEWLREGAARQERRFEIRSALRAIAHATQPRSYLEIGTRRGWSLAQVLAESPEVQAYSFDWWMHDYGGVDNPGPGFVRNEMRRVAPDHRGALHFLSGNSHDTLPVFFQEVQLGPVELDEVVLLRTGEAAPRMFDLITVDGDHTALGTWWDLADVLPHMAVGGALVFDDLLDSSDELLGDSPSSRYADIRSHPDDLRPSLLWLWEHVKSVLDGWEFIESFDSIVPIGIAVRMR
ncbi:class I SAM-dependent methyltransferase [Gemmatimonas sp.]|uniref:class I SAM-dependent methyltransferase n=1 Tax=Gemmatimonas sp. TaxID=1962908 RepID=UPI00286E8D83|nr:class I SAM-dependent methyltransferase [Gemmatimonas sp.]